LVFSPWAGMAGTRAQSGDQYGSDTLHPGQVIRGSLPLLSPTLQYRKKRANVSQDKKVYFYLLNKGQCNFIVTH